MLKRKQLPDIDFLKSILEYDPNTGLLIWKPRPYTMYKHKGFCDKFNRESAGKIATHLGPRGYLIVSINRTSYFAHRIIFFMEHGYCPDVIDHDDGNQTNNKIKNLKESTNQKNNQNMKKLNTNISGVTGVSWHKKYQKWQVHINVNKKLKNLGMFTDLNEAIKIRKIAEKENNYHINHGKRR